MQERLKHSNSAVVLATTKVFLNLTQDMPEVHKQVGARLDPAPDPDAHANPHPQPLP